jgi:hypothetical protein
MPSTQVNATPSTQAVHERIYRGSYRRALGLPSIFGVQPGSTEATKKADTK